MTIFDKPQWSLYSGLTCVLIAIVCQRMGVNPILFWLFLAFGIGFKILFLFRVFRVSKVHLGVGLYLLLSGILLLLITLIAKSYWPDLFFLSLLYYVSFVLKGTGVILLILRK